MAQCACYSNHHCCCFRCVGSNLIREFAVTLTCPHQNDRQGWARGVVHHVLCKARPIIRSCQSWAGANPQSLTLMAASEPHHEEVIVGAPQPSLNGLNRVAAWC